MIPVTGFEKCSTVDFPGLLAGVVFTPGCNMNCAFCHNRQILGSEQQLCLDQTALLEDLKKRRKLLDGLVITGGEPTLHSGLEAFIRKVRELGYQIKLDTNGTHPQMLSHLIREGLLDYVAMDIKAPPNKYKRVCGARVDMDDIFASVQVLKQGRVDYEFRTTVLPEFDAQDMLKMSLWLREAKRYILQQYRPVEDYSRAHPESQQPHPAATIAAFASQASRLIERCETRGIDRKHTFLQQPDELGQVETAFSAA